MGYVEENLMPNEGVVARTTLHPVLFWGPITLFLIGVFFIVVGGPGSIVALSWLLAVAFAISALINYKKSEFAVTTSRLILKTGWVSRRSIELQLNKVEGLSIDQGLLGRLLDYGTIRVGGTGGSKERFAFIREPVVFRKAIQLQIAETFDPQRKSFDANPGSVDRGRSERDCPYCAERILAAAKVCKHCKRGLHAET